MPEATMGEMSRWTFYQRVIAEHARDTDPRCPCGVHART